MNVTHCVRFVLLENQTEKQSTGEVQLEVLIVTFPERNVNHLFNSAQLVCFVGLPTL